MSTFVVDISNVEGHISTFPHGPCEATVKTAKLDVAQDSGNQMIVMELELFHPTYGTASLRDYLPHGFPAKFKAFWRAVNDFTEEQLAANPVIEVEPSDLVGAQFLVQIGDRENKKTKKVYRGIIAPWYYPLSQATKLLAISDDELPL